VSGEIGVKNKTSSKINLPPGIAATGTAAHVRALGCLPSKNMGAIGPTTNKNNVTIMTRSEDRKS